MKYSDELIKKAKSAKSAEELRRLAEENGVELSEELEAKYKSLHSEGEITDDELSNVAGGCGEDPQPVQKYYDDCCENYSERKALAYTDETVKFHKGTHCEGCIYFWTDLEQHLDPNYNGYGYCFYGVK